MYRYIWLVPLLPLAGAAINGLLGKRLRFSETVVGAVAISSVALALLISLLAVISYGFGNGARAPKPYITSEDGGFHYTWIPGGATRITAGYVERSTQTSESTEQSNKEASASEPASANAGSVLDIQWSYQLDPLSGLFMLIITGVGLCIFIFATGYMHGDTGFYRFFAYLGLFMFSMLVLVMGSNFMMMFVGWEGVGLCSYLLIGYYFDRKEAGDASRKAFVANRVGDFGFSLGIFGIIATFGTVQYTQVAQQAAAFPIELIGHWGVLSWIALGLFIGACGKSAQIPLYVWLPDAMAGPTPVSALIHAATMVTAGLYMITRTNVIFQHSQTMMMVVAIVGAATAIFAATIGITQNDIKKVLAYSTVSQLGFMVLACGVGAFTIGIFHVMTHAFFKGLMFLGAGSVIHGMHHEQDMRRMGGLKKYMPYTYWTFFAGWLAICGIIPFSGFWSKDEILWKSASTTVIPGGWILWFVATIAAGCTAFYMTRLMALTFWGEPRFLKVSAGSEGDEAHALAYDEGHSAHDAATFSAGDRPHHEPGEHVGIAHEVHAGHSGEHVHDAHEHGSHVPHESPKSMWVPLLVLAILATFGGFLGVGPAFKALTGSEHPGGKLNIVNWLDPLIWNPSTHAFGTEGAEPEGVAAKPPHPASTGKEEVAKPYGETGFNLAETVEHSLGASLTEWLFVIISLVVAGTGMLLGFYFYLWNPGLPDVWSARLRPLYNASFNKYWIDELYGYLFTRRTMDLSRGVYAFDSRILDGIVNGAAAVTRFLSVVVGLFDKYIVDGIVNMIGNFIGELMSRVIRSSQTGFAPNYALVMIIGLVIAVVIFFSGDIAIALKGMLAFHF